MTHAVEEDARLRARPHGAWPPISRWSTRWRPPAATPSFSRSGRRRSSPAASSATTQAATTPPSTTATEPPRSRRIEPTITQSEQVHDEHADSTAGTRHGVISCAASASRWRCRGWNRCRCSARTRCRGRRSRTRRRCASASSTSRTASSRSTGGRRAAAPAMELGPAAAADDAAPRGHGLHPGPVQPDGGRSRPARTWAA